MEPTPLTVIQQDLLADEFDARLLGVDDENLYERLFVVFDREEVDATSGSFLVNIPPSHIVMNTTNQRKRSLFHIRLCGRVK